ncbi:MAG TPA: hypothetical protein ENG94_07505 [Actinobacteria bacterium]|nr:hypothetical protein [Actinomycetota bacterium]
MPPHELPYVATEAFLETYVGLLDDTIDVLDPQLDALLRGGYAEARFRRDRVQGESGGAFILSVPTSAGTVWHVYWDFSDSQHAEIVFIALVEIAGP